MRLLPLLGTALVSTATVAAMVTPAAQAASTGATFSRWTYTADFAQGSFTRAAAAKGTVTMTSGTSSAWTSPWKSVGFSAKSLVPSWAVTTPSGTSAVIEARVRQGKTIGSWDTVASWTGSRRSSGTSQRDDLARLETDTVVAASTFDAWQVRITLRRTSANGTGPSLRAVNGVAASYLTRTPSTSTTGMTRTVELPVPTSSQMTHRGHYPQWGNGSEAWCSPTSTSMIMRYFGKGPSASTYAWTKESNGYVDHAARYTYDSAYEGTGNWSFNTAYAAGYGLDAFVTRLDSLREAEAFIKAGIPLAASLAYSKGQLTGAPISSTPGHLMVIRGFRSDGAVIVNDPAGSSDKAVRRIYSRSQFERAWQRGSGGIVYVIRPLSTKLPSDTPRW